MNFFISSYNDLTTAFFITFVFYFLNYIHSTEYKRYFIFLFITIITPIIIFSQLYANPFMNIKAFGTKLFYSLILLLLLLLSFILNAIQFKNKSFNANYELFYKYIIMFIITTFILKNFFIGVINIGIIHSITGPTNAKALVDILKFQIFKLNANGGINGKKINAEFIDGKSEPLVYMQGVQTFINNGIKTIFGAWTSNDRKSIIPIIEKNNALLFYPIQYEGQECSKNIIYTGSVPNQQLEVGTRWALHNLGTQFYLIGTDSVYARTANKIIRAVIEKNNGKVLGETYIVYGSTEYNDVVSKIMQNSYCIILNTINGTNANKSFFETLYNSYINKTKGQVFIPVSEVYPIISFSITEDTFTKMKTDYIMGHYAVWSYFQTLKNKLNEQFVNEYKKFYKNKHDIIVNDPMISSYISFALWSRAVSELDNHTDLTLIKQQMLENPYQTPAGEVILNTNNHLSKFVRIGKGNKNNLFDVIYSTLGPVDPIVWNDYLTDSSKMKCDHGQYLYGSSYKNGPLTLEVEIKKQVGTTSAAIQPSSSQLHAF